MREGTVPNTTQIPHIIIREWLPKLKDVELRVLLIVADQTLGWIEDIETGRRKEKDWISHYQLREKTGRKDRSISIALKRLIEGYGIIEAYNEQGKPLDSAVKRQLNGDKIFYRLALKKPQQTLFSTPAKSAQVLEMTEKNNTTKNENALPPQKVRTQKVRTTKETVITNNTLQQQSPVARDVIKKSYTPHKQFVEFWFKEVQRARGIRPIITGRDGSNLKRILDTGIKLETLEQAGIYFLNNESFKKFSPSLSTFLSAGIINGLLNRIENHPQFWKELEIYLSARGIAARDTPDNWRKTLSNIRSGLSARMALQK